MKYNVVSNMSKELRKGSSRSYMLIFTVKDVSAVVHIYIRTYFNNKMEHFINGECDECFVFILNSEISTC